MINVVINTDNIDLDVLCMFESWADGNISYRGLRDFLVKHVVGEDDVLLPEDEAKRMVGALKLSELNDALTAINDAIANMKDEAVPPATGG